MNHLGLGGGGYQDLSGSTTKEKTFFYVRLPLSVVETLTLHLTAIT